MDDDDRELLDMEIVHTGPRNRSAAVPGDLLAVSPVQLGTPPIPQLFPMELETADLLLQLPPSQTPTPPTRTPPTSEQSAAAEIPNRLAPSDDGVPRSFIVCLRDEYHEVYVGNRVAFMSMESTDEIRSRASAAMSSPSPTTRT